MRINSIASTVPPGRNSNNKLKLQTINFGVKNFTVKEIIENADKIKKQNNTYVKKLIKFTQKIFSKFFKTAPPKESKEEQLAKHFVRTEDKNYPEKTHIYIDPQHFYTLRLNENTKVSCDDDLRVNEIETGNSRIKFLYEQDKLRNVFIERKNEELTRFTSFNNFQKEITRTPEETKITIQTPERTLSKLCINSFSNKKTTIKDELKIDEIQKTAHEMYQYKLLHKNNTYQTPSDNDLKKYNSKIVTKRGEEIRKSHWSTQVINFIISKNKEDCPHEFLVNANYDESLIQKLDNLSKKYPFYYFFPAKSEGWKSDTPIRIIYPPNSVEKDFIEDLKETTKPYIRGDFIKKPTGEIISEGIAGYQHPSNSHIEKLKEDISKLNNPHLTDAFLQETTLFSREAFPAELYAVYEELYFPEKETNLKIQYKENSDKKE